MSLTASKAGENSQTNDPEHTIVSSILADPIFTNITDVCACLEPQARRAHRVDVSPGAPACAQPPPRALLACRTTRRGPPHAAQEVAGGPLSARELQAPRERPDPVPCQPFHLLQSRLARRD